MIVTGKAKQLGDRIDRLRFGPFGDNSFPLAAGAAI